MPSPSAKKPRKRATRAAPPDAAVAASAAHTPRDAATLEAECQRLKQELAQAMARIAELEHNRDQVLDRIAWAVDSLHSLLEE
jgi:septal ring factor EnvC (AmiA/AmiB activator)